MVTTHYLVWGVWLTVEWDTFTLGLTYLGVALLPLVSAAVVAWRVGRRGR